MSFRRHMNDQSGFALVSVLILMLVGTLFALAAWTTSKADIKPSAKDRASKQAYAAAEAGVNYYLFRLAQNNAYWSDCDQVDTGSAVNPVNLEGATTLRWSGERGFAYVRGSYFLRDERPGPTEVERPGQSVWDLGVGWRILEPLELRLLGRNLTDRRYRDSPDEVAPLARGRSFSVGLVGRY